jgi:hypothetical protein
MTEPLPILMENAIQIAWDYLERTGELGEPEIASRFLLDAVAQMVRHGERPGSCSRTRRSTPTSVLSMSANTWRWSRNNPEAVIPGRCQRAWC